MSATASAPLLRALGALDALPAADRAAILNRAAGPAGAMGVDDAVRARVAQIIARVRRDGDEALRQLAHELDGVALDRLEVPRAAWQRAVDALDPSLRRAIERARDNIERAHRAFLPPNVELETEPGIVVGRRADALARVGVYAPGGRAAYPSSVLMGVIPARVAGVGEVILCSPPSRDGAPSQVVLATAALAGVDRVFSLGGAGAIAAMACGTETVPRVDRVVGPGNAYVAEAKAQLASAVGIDCPAGPSELLVIADQSADATSIARELLAQAEHDPLAAVVAVVLGDALRDRIVAELVRLLASQPRRVIIEQALLARGAVLSARTIDDAINFANAYAPEHVMVVAADARAVLDRLRNAGTVFVGASSSVAFGDYMTGANHVLPTGGLARLYSGLSTLDFVRWTTYQRVSPEAAARMAADVGVFADAEGLPAHAAAARAWGQPQ